MSSARRFTKMMRDRALALCGDAERAGLVSVWRRDGFEGTQLQPPVPMGRVLRRWTLVLCVSEWWEDERPRF